MLKLQQSEEYQRYLMEKNNPNSKYNRRDEEDDDEIVLSDDSDVDNQKARKYDWEESVICVAACNYVKKDHYNWLKILNLCRSRMRLTDSQTYRELFRSFSLASYSDSRRIYSLI